MARRPLVISTRNILSCPTNVWIASIFYLFLESPLTNALGVAEVDITSVHGSWPRTSFKKAAWLGDRRNWVFNIRYCPQAFSIADTNHFLCLANFRFATIFLLNLCITTNLYPLREQRKTLLVYTERGLEHHLIRLLDLVIDGTGCSM